jgi:hypothetical protein
LPPGRTVLVVSVLRIELTLFLIAVATAITFGLLIGRINTKGLLHVEAGGSFSPARLQLLVFTSFQAGALFFQVLASPSTFPEIPPEFLIPLAGSDAFYLLAKSFPVVKQLASRGG